MHLFNKTYGCNAAPIKTYVKYVTKLVNGVVLVLCRSNKKKCDNSKSSDF